MAPEVVKLMDFRGKNLPKEELPAYGCEADIWSAGVIIFILLGGYTPFQGENDAQLFESIRAGGFHFDEGYWEHISDEAKDFVSRMLTLDPEERPSASQLLHHHWLNQDRQLLRRKSLIPSLVRLKSYSMRRKFKGAVKAVIAAHRIKRCFGRRLSTILMHGHHSFVALNQFERLGLLQHQHKTLKDDFATFRQEVEAGFKREAGLLDQCRRDLF